MPSMFVAFTFFVSIIKSMSSIRCVVLGKPIMHSETHSPFSVLVVLSGMMLMSASSWLTCAVAVSGEPIATHAPHNINDIANLVSFIVS
jgi:hypothetical protein